MTWFSAILVFVILWWLVFFISLPFGARSFHEAGERTESGNAESAPMRPRLWLKAGVTTVVAGVLTALVHYLIAVDAISFRPGPPPPPQNSMNAPGPSK